VTDSFLGKSGAGYLCQWLQSDFETGTTATTPGCGASRNARGSCRGSPRDASAAPEEVIVLIEVFGPGCAKCRRSAETAREFLARHGLPGEVVKHSDIDVMVDRGILHTPTVLVDGEKVVEGRVLRDRDLEAFLARRGG